jgi:hypothetical protein
VGVVAEWKWPSPEAAIEEVGSDDFDKIKAVIAEGNCKANIQAKDWVGKVVADTLGLDLTVKDDKASVKLMIEGWIKAGKIKVMKRRCPIKREDKDFIDMVEAPHPEQGGAGKVLH